MRTRPHLRRSVLINGGGGFPAEVPAHGLARARADGCPAFLETANPRTVPLYQSLGFQITGEQPAPDGGPTIWFMQTLRLPARRAAIPQPAKPEIR